MRYEYGAASDAASLTANACARTLRLLDPVGEVSFTYDQRGNKASTSRRFFLSDPGMEIDVLAMENANIAGGGLSLGPYIYAGNTFAGELRDHEAFHTLQNRIFGPIFTFTVIPLTLISNIITAIRPPATNPAFVDAGEPPNWDNWLNPWEAWAEAAV